MKKFKSFTEEKDIPYKLVIIQNTNEELSDVKDKDKFKSPEMDKAGDKAGLETVRLDFTGLYKSEKNGKIYLNSFDFDDTGKVELPNHKGELKIKAQPPVEIDPENTLIMPRGLGTFGMTNTQTWTDIVQELSLNGCLIIPSLECWYNCSSKYLTDILCRHHGLQTPKTIPLAYSDDSERVMKLFDDKFPIVLKTSIGSQTGVGVVIVESMRSLKTTVQMLKLYDSKIPLLLQEFIKTDYDVRVVVLDGQVMGAMKREVIQDGDFRSNVSLGADSGSFELTELEEKDSITAAAAVKGRLTGVDFIPAKNREKEQPYILEVNSMPGFGGIEKIEKGMTQKILEYFKDRDNWK
jgi:ribosomal protein S6--L-glutamate ligase